MQIRILAAVLVAMLTLSACGQSGPLYLPDEQPAEQQN
nr:lipoprotein [Thaumasiovibrio occultus]